MSLASARPRAEFLLGDLQENFNKHYFRDRSGRALRFRCEDLAEFMATRVPSTVDEVERWGRYLRPDARRIIQERYQATACDLMRQISETSDNDSDRFDTLLRWVGVASTYTYNMFINIWPFARERNIYYDNEVDALSLRIPSSMRGGGVLHRWTLHHLNRFLNWIPDANDFLPPGAPKALKSLAKRARPVAGRVRRGVRRRRSSKPVTGTSGSWLLAHELYRKDPGYRSRLASVLEGCDGFADDIFDRERIRESWSEYLDGRIDRHFEIEALFSFGQIQERLPLTTVACGS